MSALGVVATWAAGSLLAGFAWGSYVLLRDRHRERGRRGRVVVDEHGRIVWDLRPETVWDLRVPHGYREVSRERRGLIRGDNGGAR